MFLPGSASVGSARLGRRPVRVAIQRYRCHNCCGFRRVGAGRQKSHSVWFEGLRELSIAAGADLGPLAPADPNFRRPHLGQHRREPVREVAHGLNRW
jgi:hypothetical protein